MTDFEREDMELKFVMGDLFQDMSDAKPKPKKTAETSVQKSEAVSHPVKRNFSDKLADCAKSTLTYGGLNALILYWQIQGLMADSIALPCMLVCALMAGIGIGKVFAND